jgi:hypothetical protein
MIFLMCFVDGCVFVKHRQSTPPQKKVAAEGREGKGREGKDRTGQDRTGQEGYISWLKGLREGEPPSLIKRSRVHTSEE